MPRSRYLGDRRSTYTGSGRVRGERQTYTGQPATPVVVPASHHRGILGELGHLAKQTGSDLADAAIHAPGGAVAVGKLLEQGTVAALTGNQKKLDENARQIKQLGRGTLAQVRSEAQHPLRHPGYTLLDLLTLGTAGVGAAGRVAEAGRVARAGGAAGDVLRAAARGSEARSTLTVRSPRAAATGTGPVAKRLTDTKPLVRGRQVLTSKLLSRAKYTAPVVGEGARYGKEIRRAATFEGMKELPAYRAYVHATKRLNDHEWAALNIIARDVHPADLAEFWKGKKLADVVTSKHVARLAVAPTERLSHAVNAARALSQQGARLLEEQGFLGADTAAAKPGQFRRLVTDTLGRQVDALHGEPFYVPDVARPTRTGDPFAAFGGGKGAPRAPGSAKINRGILARLGKIDIEGDVLGPEFVRRVKLKVHTAVHEGLLDAAQKVRPHELNTILAEHGGLPKGWEYVRAPIVTKSGSIRSQRIGAINQIPGDRGATPHSLGELIPNPDDLAGSRLAEPIGTTDQKLAHFDGQHYFLAPKTTIRAAAGEFHRSSGAVRTLVEKPLQVWRALVLGLRVGFFTNNVVGNHLLYTIRTAGIGGLRAYLHAVADAHGTQKVAELLHMDYVPDGVRHQLMSDFFPDQLEGTFGRTQAPTREGLLPSRGKKIANKLGAGIVPATQAVAESVPRKALVEVMIRRSPEFRHAHRELPLQTRTFDAAARKVLAGDGGPEFQRLISEQVNHALGNYLNLSPLERNAIRNVLPFYAWYRAIATITFHLAADTPGRALALAQLGKIGSESSDKTLGELPSYLRGAIPIGQPHDGEATVLGTQGLNPFSTLPQLASGVTSDVGEIGLNPFVQAALDEYARARRNGGSIGLAPLAGAVGSAITKGLPVARLISPMPPSPLYQHRDRHSELAGFLGAPIKKVNLAEARRRASLGR